MDRVFIKEKCGVLALVPYGEPINKYDYALGFISKEKKNQRDIVFNGLSHDIDPSFFNVLFVFTVFLEKLNHRGYDGYGFAINIDGVIYSKTYTGKVSSECLLSNIIGLLLEDTDDISTIRLDSVRYLVGHVRYSTNGGYEVYENQPYISKENNMGLCFNGNIEIPSDYGDAVCKVADNSSFDNNKVKGNAECVSLASYFDRDTSIDGRVKSALNTRKYVDGAFSSIVFDERRVYGYRDKLGTRPLAYACCEELAILSSESCIVKNDSVNLDVEFKDISCDEIIAIDKDDGLTIKHFNDQCFEKLCLFEYIYFSDSQSISYGRKIEDYRYDLGKMLGNKEDGILRDKSLLIHVPKSSYHSSRGFRDTVNVQSDEIIKKALNYKRSFIQRKSNIKDVLNDKFTFSNVDLTGISIYLIDDSLVRGNTMSYLIEKIKSLGAKEIHIRVASPMIKKGCNLGICTMDEEVICKNMSVAELCEYFNVDSIKFLNVEEIIDLFGNRFCTKCFIGD